MQTDLVSVCTSPADLDKLIQSIHFENQQYVKQIEQESAKITEYEKLVSDVEKSNTELQSYINRLDEEAKRVHGHFKINRDRNSSLKTTGKMLTEHLDMIHIKLQNMDITAQKVRSEREDIVKHYQNIWAEYKLKYETFPLAQELKSKHEEIQEVSKTRDMMNYRYHGLEKEIKQMNVLDGVDIYDLNNFIIGLIQIKVKSDELNKRTDENYQIYNKKQESIRQLKQEITEMENRLVEAQNKMYNHMTDNSLIDGGGDYREESAYNRTTSENQRQLEANINKRKEMHQDNSFCVKSNDKHYNIDSQNNSETTDLPEFSYRYVYGKNEQVYDNANTTSSYPSVFYTSRETEQRLHPNSIGMYSTQCSSTGNDFVADKQTSSSVASHKTLKNQNIFGHSNFWKSPIVHHDSNLNTGSNSQTNQYFLPTNQSFVEQNPMFLKSYEYTSKNSQTIAPEANAYFKNNSNYIDRSLRDKDFHNYNMYAKDHSTLSNNSDCDVITNPAEKYNEPRNIENSQIPNITSCQNIILHPPNFPLNLSLHTLENKQMSQEMNSSATYELQTAGCYLIPNQSKSNISAQLYKLSGNLHSLEINSKVPDSDNARNIDSESSYMPQQCRYAHENAVTSKSISVDQNIYDSRYSSITKANSSLHSDQSKVVTTVGHLEPNYLNDAQYINKLRIGHNNEKTQILSKRMKQLEYESRYHGDQYESSQEISNTTGDNSMEVDHMSHSVNYIQQKPDRFFSMADHMEALKALNSSPGQPLIKQRPMFTSTNDQNADHKITGNSHNQVSPMGLWTPFSNNDREPAFMIGENVRSSPMMSLFGNDADDEETSADSGFKFSFGQSTDDSALISLPNEARSLF